MKRMPISEIAEVNPRLPSEVRRDEDKPVSFVAMADVAEGGFVATYQERSLRDVVKGYTYFRRGDVLSAKITPCMQNGKAAVTDAMPHGIGFGSTEFHVLRPGPQVAGRYLFHMIWSPYYRRSAERSFTGTAGQQRVPTDFFNRFKIPLPPLPEQKRIAGILDKADALRRKRQQALELTEQFLRSTFLDMFGDPVTNPKCWPMHRLATLLTMPLRNGVSPATEGRHEERVLTLSAITQGPLDPTAVKVACFAELPPAEKRVDHRDFLICRGNGNLGLCGAGRYPPEDMHDTIFPDTMIASRVDDSVLFPSYLESLWGTRFVRDQLERGPGRQTGPIRSIKP